MPLIPPELLDCLRALTDRCESLEASVETLTDRLDAVLDRMEPKS